MSDDPEAGEGIPLLPAPMRTNESASPMILTHKQPPPPPPLPQQQMQALSISNKVPPSPAPSDISDELPNNVSSEEQLKLLPDECLSGDPDRPLRHVDESEEESFYSLTPMAYSVIFILLVELLERFSFYGINYTQTSYLTGVYNDDWNAGMEAIPASTYVSISVAVAYTTPFAGAFLADALLGEYWAILVGSLGFYLPGLFLIACTTIPGLLGHEFNRRALQFGFLFLWPTGTGIVKSVVNVFGAKQHHPILQASQIEAYYVQFYMCINIGALVGGIIVPLCAQNNVTIAYFLPVAMLTLGIFLFILGSNRYVRMKPKGSLFPSKKQKYASAAAATNGESINLGVIVRISILVVPFNVAYSQMATTFILQGNVMKKAFGYIDAASMNNADAIAVLLFGSWVSSHLYPWMANRGIKLPTTYKFAIGSALGALSIAWALLVEFMIHREYERTGHNISIMWQALSYILIGAGEIFAVSAAYEAAFTASPPEKKVLASALNLFCIGGLPNAFCILLYQACRPWFENKDGNTNITRLENYATAHVANYFWVLFFIAMTGVVVNVLPPVRGFVESIEEKASDLLKSPKTPMRPPRRERSEMEDSPLIRAKRHQAYLKYGSGPVLYKSGSMRAGASLSVRGLDPKKAHMKRSMISKLYRSEPLVPGYTPILSSKGKPVMAGSLLRKPQMQMSRNETPLSRSNSLDREGPELPRSNSG